MGVTYFKRYRMDIGLEGVEEKQTDIRDGFLLLPWSPELLRDHAKVKWECFHNEIDANVFPCLGRKEGCLHLMKDIAARSNFIPDATWLAVKIGPTGKNIPVGTVQGVRHDSYEGAIQNLGVSPEYRGLGLGTVLLFEALRGFARVGCLRAHLEVTVQNTAAVRLYERLGFHRVETVFKVADVAMA